MLRLSEKPIKVKGVEKVEILAPASEAIAASKLTLYAGGASSALAWWQTIDWLAVGGIFLATAGFFMNFYFSYKKHKREDLEHKIRVGSKYED